MSYKKLEIWQLARELVIDIHRMALQNLPKFEMYEEGNQIRKSSIEYPVSSIQYLLEEEPHVSRS